MVPLGLNFGSVSGLCSAMWKLCWVFVGIFDDVGTKFGDELRFGNPDAKQIPEFSTLLSFLPNLELGGASFLSRLKWKFTTWNRILMKFLMTATAGVRRFI